MAIAIVFVLSYLPSDNFSHFGLLFVNVVQNVPTTPFTLWYRFPKTFFHLYLAFLLGFYNFSGKLKLIAFSN